MTESKGSGSNVAPGCSWRAVRAREANSAEDVLAWSLKREIEASSSAKRQLMREKRSE